MSSQDLIQSGLLELYALNLCSTAERTLVEEGLEKDKAIRREFDEICAALEQLAYEQVCPLPESLRESMVIKPEEAPVPDSKPARSVKRKVPPEKPVTEKPELPSPKKEPVIGGFRLRQVVIALAIVLLGSVVLHIISYVRMNKAGEEIAHLTNNNLILSDDLGISESRYQALKEQFSELFSPGTEALTLHSTVDSLDREAFVFWNRRSGAVYLIIRALPRPAEGEQYQLWGIDNQLPKNAGVIPTDFETGVVYELKNISSAQYFTISLETKGGSTEPTPNKVVLSGSL